MVGWMSSIETLSLNLAFGRKTCTKVYNDLPMVQLRQCILLAHALHLKTQGRSNSAELKLFICTTRAAVVAAIVLCLQLLSEGQLLYYCCEILYGWQLSIEFKQSLKFGDI